MKDISKEIIEIDGQEYTLFLNRKGIVAWEKFCQSENEKLEEFKEKYKNITKINENSSEIEITDETNPFEGLEELEDVDEDKKVMSIIYKRLYWIMLYTEHKFSITKVNELYDIACKEYGEEQIVQLAVQMIEDINTNPFPDNKELKNLKALKPKKN